MKTRRLNISRGWSRSMVSCLFPILAALLCLQFECQAQQQFASQSDASVNPLKSIDWVSGPQKVTLGDVADIYIPDGYRLTDLHGARMILTTLNIPVPDDLVGVLAPTAGKWLVILEYSPTGYVKKPGVTKIDTTAVLKEVLDETKAQEGKSSIASLSWASQPSYDTRRHLLEWSFQVVTPSGTKILNRSVVVLGRRGVLQITLVQHASSTDTPSLTQLASNITFKNGQRYTDYQKGDEVAEIGLADLILGEKHTQTASLPGGWSGAMAAWIYSGLGVCLIAGGVAAVRRRNKTPRQPEHRRHYRHTPVPAPTIKNEAPVNSTASKQLSLALKDNESNGHAQPKPLSSQSNSWKPSHHRHHRHQKRVFDHTKFYMKVLRDFTHNSYELGGMTDGKSHSNGHANSHGSDEANVHANDHSDDHVTAVPKGANADDVIKSEVDDLIATQRKMIEEQRGLLEQQTKLIEEKRRLIEEQTALLKAQSDLVAAQCS